MLAAGLVDIQTVDSTIQVDVKYATTDNFMGQVLYPDYHKVYLQPVVAERLSLAQKALQKIDSSLTLLVFDGTACCRRKIVIGTKGFAENRLISHFTSI